MSYIDAYIKCPYFVRSEPKTCHLTCEGIPPGSTVKCHFDNGEAMKRAIWNYCVKAHEKCPWKRFLDTKYE